MIGWRAYPVLFLVSLAAGFVDSVAGGGGLITVPALLLTGINPATALGTNKLQSTFGSGSALRVFLRAGTVRWRESADGFLWTFLGAAAGAGQAMRLRKELLGEIIPFLLAGLIVLLVLKPDVGRHERRPRLSRPAFHLVFGLGLGFYDGFFGPGTGTFWAMSYVLALGFDLTRATGHAKLMNFSSNLSALIILGAGGDILYGAGLVMGAGQFIGGRAGSKMVVARGVRFVRPVLLAAALAVTAKLFWERFGQLLIANF